MVRIFPAFITPDEQARLVEIAKSIRPHLNPNGASPHRFYRHLHELPDIDPLLRELEYRAWAATGFTAAERDGAVPHYFSVNEPGGAIHPHTDPGNRGRGTLNTRFNVMVRKPAGGGDVVVDEAAITVRSGDAWTFIATNHVHRSTAVEDGWRIVVGYGFQIAAGDRRLKELGIE